MNRPTPDPDRPRNQRRGIALMVLATIVFASMDTITKLLAADYAPPQILWVRFAVFFLVALAIVRRRNPLRALRSRHPAWQTARSLLLVVEIGVFIVSLGYLPLAEVVAIASAAPLMVTALAAPVLGERVDGRRWLAVALGFAGVLVIVRPGFGEASHLLLIPLTGAALWAVYQLMVRRLASVDGADTTVFYTATVGLAAMCFIGPFYWQEPDARGWLMLAAVATLGATGHGLIIKALHLADASVLQVFGYIHLVAATALGFMVFGQWPDGPTLGGAALIVASGMWVARDERRARMAEAAAAVATPPPPPAGR
jgi:drug/metabolite transporter (DMT)-like permease